MGKYLLQDKLVRAFTKGVGSSYSAALNILLFLSILISVVTPYTYLGLGLVLVISAIEIWFVLNVFLVLRSTSVGYKIIDATFEWNISDPNTKIIRSKKKFVVRLTQFVNSICYYLEPGERIIQTSGVLPVYSNKKYEAAYYGHTPVELYFQRYYSEGTESQVEIITEIRKEQPSKTGSITLYSHNAPQRLNLLINFGGLDNGNHVRTTLQYFKGRQKKVITDPKAELVQQETCRKVMWESDQIVNDAVYTMGWSYD